MGNCTVTVLKKNIRPSGRSAIVKINLSSSYATGGDTVPRSLLGIGNRISALILASGHTQVGNALEVVPGATEYADPKIRVWQAAAGGTEVAAAGNLSAQSVIAEVIASPFK